MIAASFVTTVLIAAKINSLYILLKFPFLYCRNFPQYQYHRNSTDVAYIAVIYTGWAKNRTILGICRPNFLNYYNKNKVKVTQ